MDIDHIEVIHSSSSDDYDRIEINSINVTSTKVIFNITISKLSTELRNYLNDNNNYCYITPFVRNSSNTGHQQYSSSKYGRGTEKRRWFRYVPYNPQTQHCHWDTLMTNIRINNLVSFSTTIEYDKDLFETLRSKDHLKYDPGWDYYFKRFMLRLVMCDADDIGKSGYKSCYSEMNSDKFIVYYNNYDL